MREKAKPLTAAEYIKLPLYSAKVVPIYGDSETYILSGSPEQVVTKACELCSWAAAGLGKTFEVILTEVRHDT